MKKLWLKIKSFFASKPAGDPQGTSEIKDVVKNVVNIIAEFKKAKADDNKIKGLEWVGIGKAALPLVQNVKKWETLKAQLLDFTTEEGSEMAGWLAMQGIIGEEAKLLVKHAIAAIEKSIAIYNTDIKEIIRILRM